MKMNKLLLKPLTQLLWFRGHNNNFSLVSLIKNSDQVFDDTCSNESVFNSTMEEIIDKSFQGYHCIFISYLACVLAYGQTCSGKTHTMRGEIDQPGLIPLTIREIYNRIKKQDLRARVKVAYFEIYNDKVYDLF